MEKNWRVHPYVNHIQVRRLNFEGFDYSWISRKANQAADWVANRVKKMCFSNWVGLPHILLYTF